MLIKKKAQQKNVILDKNFYNEVEIKQFLFNKECFYLTTEEEVIVSFSVIDYVQKYLKEPIIRVFLEQGDKIVVELIDGFYINVLIKDNGHRYIVKLNN